MKKKPSPGASAPPSPENGRGAKGRKLFDGKDEILVLAKLERCFCAGCTDAQASLYAGISVDALYRYEKENPEFRKRKTALKESPELKARLTLNRNLGKANWAAWYLERKVKEEFSTRAELTGAKGGSISVEEKTNIAAVAAAVQATGLLSRLAEVVDKNRKPRSPGG